MDYTLLGGGTAGEIPRGNKGTKHFLWGSTTQTCVAHLNKHLLVWKHSIRISMTFDRQREKNSWPVL